MLGADGELDDVGVLLAHLGVNLFQVLGHLAQVVVADDALDVAKTAYLIDDVGFQIDPVEAGDDGLAQQRQARFLGALPGAAVGRPADRGHQRARFVGQQSLEVGRLGNIVQAHLDQARSLLGGFLDLDLNHLVTCPADDDADRFRGIYHGGCTALSIGGTFVL